MGRTDKLYAVAAAVVLLGALASSPRAVGEEPRSPTETFHQIVESLVDAENREDSASMASLFTEDAILLPPGGSQLIQGKDNIRRFLDEYAKHRMDNHTVKSTVLMLSGTKTMIDAGTWTGDIPGENGARPTHVEGTYMAVGVLVHGEWKLWANSWHGAAVTGAAGSTTAPQIGTSLPTK